MMEIIKHIWQLPQHLAALVYYCYLVLRKQILMIDKQEKWVIYTKSTTGSVTLGKYIFASFRATEMTIKHETGHTMQSLILGPLYLIVIGLPSILWACTHRIIAPNKSYYWFYPELWANKLAGL